jgi:signal transduction histidine kinase
MSNEMIIASHGFLSLCDAFLIAFFYNRFLGRRYKRAALYIGLYVLYFAANFYMSAFVADKLFRSIFSIAFPLAVALIYSGVFIQQMFAAVLIIAFRFVTEPFIAVVISWLAGISFSVADNSILYFLSGLLATLTSYAMVAPIVRKRTHQFHTMARQHVAILMCMVVACTFLAYVDMTLIFQNNRNATIINLLTESFVCALPMLIYVIFQDFQAFAQVKQRQGVLEEQLNQSEKMFDLLESQHKEMRELKHNLVGQVGLIAEMAKSADNIEAKQYVEDYAQTVLTSLDVVFTGVASLDALISLKKRVAEENGIKFVVNIPYFSDLRINPVVLTNVLINALDNAIEACILLAQGLVRRIELNLRIEDEYLFINVRNTSPHVKIVDGKFPMTSKPNKQFHGLGIESIRNSVEKYGGLLNYDYREPFFVLQIRMWNADAQNEASRGSNVVI